MPNNILFAFDSFLFRPLFAPKPHCPLYSAAGGIAILEGTGRPLSAHGPHPQGPIKNTLPSLPILLLKPASVKDFRSQDRIFELGRLPELD
jgi:hypothetical protein